MTRTTAIALDARLNATLETVAYYSALTVLAIIVGTAAAFLAVLAAPVVLARLAFRALSAARLWYLGTVATGGNGWRTPETGRSLLFSAVNNEGFSPLSRIAPDERGDSGLTHLPFVATTHPDACQGPQNRYDVVILADESAGSVYGDGCAIMQDDDVAIVRAANSPSDDGRTYRVEWRLAADGRASGKPGRWITEAQGMTRDEAAALVAHLDEWQDSENRIVAERRARAKTKKAAAA